MSKPSSRRRRRASRPRTMRPTERLPDVMTIEAQFHVFLMEMLRAVARGQSASKATDALIVFVDLSARARAPWGATIERAVRACNGLIEQRAAQSELDMALFDLGGAGLLLMVEALALDPAAAARSAARSDALHGAVLRFVRACERQAQREGWSYLGKLAERIGPKAQSGTGPAGNAA